MKLQLQRNFKGDYTIGKLYINNTYFCDTLEDKVRDMPKELKVWGKTAIMEGTYKIIINYSPKFKRDLPRLLNVPFFEGILIHRGNYADYKEYFKTISINDLKKELPLGSIKIT